MLPEWAAWSPRAAERPWTVGLEEEIMLVHPAGGAPAGCIDDVLANVSAELADHVSAETHSCAIELKTGVHETVESAVEELGGLRGALARALEPLGVRAAVAGTHPTAVWTDIEVTSRRRYQTILASMRALAHREPTFALHVHVAMPDGAAGVRALDGLRADLPLLLALAANSPFWQGRDTGLACARAQILSMFPRVGIARRFASYGAYVRAIDELVGAGAVPDASFLWWDARLQPRHGTLEVRIMDAQTSVGRTAALAALVQCLVRLRAEEAAPDPLSPEVVAENRFRAARDGIGATLLRGGRLEPALDRLAAVLENCAGAAVELRCARELDGVTAVARTPGDARQRALAASGGPAGLLAALEADFVPAPSAIMR